MLVFLFHVLSYDVWFYLSHLLLHTKIGWRFHKIHHEKRAPTFADTYYGHWSEGPFQSLGFLLPFAFGVWHPSAVLAALVAVNCRGILRHDARAAWLIGDHHLQHHVDPRYNFGDYWIDALCGTAAPRGTN